MLKLCAGHFILGILVTISIILTFLGTFDEKLYFLNAREREAINWSRSKKAKSIIVVGSDNGHESWTTVTLIDGTSDQASMATTVITGNPLLEGAIKTFTDKQNKIWIIK